MKSKIDLHYILEILQDLFTILFAVLFIIFMVESDGRNVRLGEKTFELALLSLVLLLIFMIVKRVIKKISKHKKQGDNHD